MRAKEAEKILFANGWYQVKQVGSHRHYKHRSKPGKVTIPIHAGDINIKTLKTIFEQAGIDV